jgi:hypothetical protein
MQRHGLVRRLVANVMVLGRITRRRTGRRAVAPGAYRCVRLREGSPGPRDRRRTSASPLRPSPRASQRRSCRESGPCLVGKGGVEPPRPYGHTDLNRARLPFRHLPVAREICAAHQPRQCARLARRVGYLGGRRATLDVRKYHHSSARGQRGALSCRGVRGASPTRPVRGPRNHWQEGSDEQA